MKKAIKKSAKSSSSAPFTGKLITIPTADVYIPPDYPRIPDADIEDLVESFKRMGGNFDPIHVRRSDPGIGQPWTLIDGSRRLRAALAMSKKTIQALDQTMEHASPKEQRTRDASLQKDADLCHVAHTAAERKRMVERLLELGVKKEDVARVTGVSIRTVQRSSSLSGSKGDGKNGSAQAPASDMSATTAKQESEPISEPTISEPPISEPKEAPELPGLAKLKRMAVSWHERYGKFDKILRQFINDSLPAIAASEGGELVPLARAQMAAGSIGLLMTDARPYCLCPRCHGKDEGCDFCAPAKGWLAKFRWKTCSTQKKALLPPELRFYIVGDGIKEMGVMDEKEDLPNGRGTKQDGPGLNPANPDGIQDVLPAEGPQTTSNGMEDVANSGVAEVGLDELF